jgi:hypothetical protein
MRNVTRLTAAAMLMCGTFSVPAEAFTLFPKKVRIFTQNVKASSICGTKYAKYLCSTTERSMSLKESDIAVELVNGQPNYRQILGMTYDDLRGNAVTLLPCGVGDENTFRESDFAQITNPTPFSFEKKATSELGASAAIDVKNLLVGAGVPAAKVEKLQAKFNSTYSRKARSEYSMTGVYQRLALKSSVTGAIQNPATTNAVAKACATALAQNREKAIIYSIAIVKLDSAKYVSNVLSDLALGFAAEVKAEAPNVDIASLALNIKNQVTTSLTVTPGTEWRVISWDYLKPL